MSDENRTLNIERDLRHELKKACDKFPDYNSPHEGYAIIKEELDELWDEVKDKNSTDLQKYKESIQVACTAIRFCQMIKKRYKGKLPVELL